MRFAVTALGLVVSVLTTHLAPAIVPDSTQDGYQGIVARNVFGLRPIVKETPAPPPQPALPKVIITGFFSVVAPKRVLLKLQMPARPPEQPVEQFPILAEGQRDGVIEVLEIDEKKGTVRLVNSGMEMLLTIEKDGPNAVNAPPTLVVAANGSAAPASTRTLIPGVRLPGLDPNVAARRAAERNLSRNSIGTAGAPTPGLEAPPLPAPPASAAVNEPPLNAEQEAVLAELEREANKK
jgi:hypothetical protein